MNSHTDADVLAAVEQSLLAAGRRDRDGWVGLFAADATIEDPVGSAPHRGRREIALFFDTFIAPREIVAHPNADIVCGATVIRDVVLEVRMGGGLTMRIPTILRYAVNEVDGVLKIAELQAFWELPPMLWQFVRNGVPAVPVAVGLGRSLLANQQMAGAVGFLTGLHRPARRHRTTVAALVGALTGGDQLAARRILHTGARVTLGDHQPLSIDALGSALSGAQQVSQIVAGPTTAVSVRTDDKPGVLLIETEPWTVRFFG